MPEGRPTGTARGDDDAAEREQETRVETPAITAGHRQEQALVERARGGDVAAFTALVNTYHAPLTGYLARLCGSRDTADDLVQETFLRAWRAIRSLRPADLDDEVHFRAWLYRIATNQAHSWLRRQRLRRWLPFGPATREPAAEDSALDTLGEREMVEQALRQIGPSHAAVLLLRHREHLSLAETASALNVSPNTAKVRLYRARKAFVAAYTAQTREELEP